MRNNSPKTEIFSHLKKIETQLHHIYDWSRGGGGYRYELNNIPHHKHT